MTRLEWGAVNTRFYQAGVDRGVLYIDNQAGIPWTGLISVVESPSGGEAKPYYIDGVKYLNVSSPTDFEATITAFTYPEEFERCEGTTQIRPGLFLTNQKSKPFGLSYRTGIGNDQSSESGYKIHIVYDALASPTERSNATLNESTNPMEFSWSITTRPKAFSRYKHTAHIVVDSRDTDPVILSLLEDTLYGTESESARIPSPAELIGIFDTISTLVVVDNGDGTWTATAPFDVIQMLDPTTFEITSSAAIFIDEDSYTLSSE